MITLQAQNLSKAYGSRQVFSALSFTVENNSLGIAGPNGSGKSTLLQCLGGLLQPGSGSINWMKDETQLSSDQLKKMMGYAAPYINLYDGLSCIENLSLLARLRYQSLDSEGAHQLLSRFQLARLADQPYGKLSTGQQQRLRLAAALFHEPDILLLDEPGANLDQEGKALITEIEESFRDDEKLLIIASNNPNELQLCERIFSVKKRVFVESKPRS